MSQTNRISAADAIISAAEAAQARVIALTDMLAGAILRAGEEPGNVELENEVRYLDDQLEQALLSRVDARDARDRT